MQMRVSDLVKVKFASEAQVSSTYLDCWTENLPGVAIEVAENACKVMFPSTNSKIHLFHKTDLEVTNEDV